MIKLDIPYFSQLDNAYNPYGSCNVTCCAMILWFYGIRGWTREQLEDQLYRWLAQRGLSRHSPYDLQTLINTIGKAYNITDTFKPDAKWGDVCQWLDAGKPVIHHGYFTRFGHIICGIGRNESGIIVHDPYGECFYNHQTGQTYYDTSRSGAGLTYSYRMMKKLCGPDGDNWVHFISRA